MLKTGLYKVSYVVRDLIFHIQSLLNLQIEFGCDMGRARNNCLSLINDRPKSSTDRHTYPSSNHDDQRDPDL